MQKATVTAAAKAIPATSRPPDSTSPIVARVRAVNASTVVLLSMARPRGYRAGPASFVKKVSKFVPIPVTHGNDASSCAAAYGASA